MCCVSGCRHLPLLASFLYRSSPPLSSSSLAPLVGYRPLVGHASLSMPPYRCHTLPPRESLLVLLLVVSTQPEAHPIVIDTFLLAPPLHRLACPICSSPPTAIQQTPSTKREPRGKLLEPRAA